MGNSPFSSTRSTRSRLSNESQLQHREQQRQQQQDDSTDIRSTEENDANANDNDDAEEEEEEEDEEDVRGSNLTASMDKEGEQQSSQLDSQQLQQEQDDAEKEESHKDEAVADKKKSKMEATSGKSTSSSGGVESSDSPAVNRSSDASAITVPVANTGKSSTANTATTTTSNAKNTATNNAATAAAGSSATATTATSSIVDDTKSDNNNDDPEQSKSSFEQKTKHSNNSNPKRRSLRKHRPPPTRFVARPSKQGWGVDEGDRAFLEDDERFLGGSSSSGNAGDADNANDATDAAAADNAGDADNVDPMNNAGSVNADSKNAGGKAASGKPVKMSPAKISTKSAAASASSTTPTTTTTTKSVQSTPSNSSWQCHRCSHSNLSIKKRCGSCQAWKGGVREGYGSSGKKKKTSPLSGGVDASEERKCASAKEEKSTDGPGVKLLGRGGRREGSGAGTVLKSALKSSSGGRTKKTAEDVKMAISDGNTSTRSKRKRGSTSMDTSTQNNEQPITKRSRRQRNKDDSEVNENPDSAPSASAGGAAASATTTTAIKHTIMSYAFSSSKRKSNISRRPRQLRPTEKILALQEEEKQKETTQTNKKKKKKKKSVNNNATNGKSKGRGKQKKKSVGASTSSASSTTTLMASSSSTTTTPTTGNNSNNADEEEEEEEWKCSRCNAKNSPTYKRCRSCQGWKGGKREGYSPSSNKRSSGSSSSSSSSAGKTSSSRRGVKRGGGAIITGGNDGGAGNNTARKTAEGTNVVGGKTKKRNKQQRKLATKDAGVAATAAAVANNNNVADDSDGEEENYDDVACCICKCAVDFSDGLFFLPPPEDKQDENKKSAAGHVDNNGKSEECDGGGANKECDGDADKVRGDMANRDLDYSANTEAAVTVAAASAANSSCTTGSCSFKGSTPNNDNCKTAKTMSGEHIEEKKDDSDVVDRGGTVDTNDTPHPVGAAADQKSASLGSVPEPTDKSPEGESKEAKNTKHDKQIVTSEQSNEADGPDKSNGKCDKDEMTVEDDDDEEKPPFLLPHRFHDPGNALILCDGPLHAGKQRKIASNKNGNNQLAHGNQSSSLHPSSSSQEYKCDRAYHQQCHFVPVLSIPRGPWRCLICRYRDEEYLKEKAERGKKRKKKEKGSSSGGGGDAGMVDEKENGKDYGVEVAGASGGGGTLSDAELNDIFRCVPVHGTLTASDEGKKEGKVENGEDVTMAESTSDVKPASSNPTIDATENNHVTITDATSNVKPAANKSSIDATENKDSKEEPSGLETGAETNDDDGSQSATESSKDIKNNKDIVTEHANEATKAAAKPTIESTKQSPSKHLADEASNKIIAQNERRFEFLASHLKSTLLHSELTSRSRNLIKSSLASIRIAEHSLRSFTETSKARKALAERVELARRMEMENEYSDSSSSDSDNDDDSDSSDGDSSSSRGGGGGRAGRRGRLMGLGLPQELCQCVMRIAQSKMRVRELVFGLENVIRCGRPRHYGIGNEVSLPPMNLKTLEDDTMKKNDGTVEQHEVNDRKEEDNAAPGRCTDVVSELMQWYLCQQQHQPSQSPLQQSKNHKLDTAITTGYGGKEKDLLHHLFPEGNLSRRRFEPRTGEAHIHHNTQQQAKDGSNNDDVNSITSISLDDLTCSNCHGSHATDDNDMLLCDGVGCYRTYHMKCLEPQLSLEDKKVLEEEDWFCPLCTAHATLIHFAQREYMGDEWEEELMNGKQSSPSPKSKDDQQLKEWETAEDVFPEAPFELRVALKLKENVRDEETTEFLADTLGLRSSTSLPADVDAAVYGENSDLLAEEDDNDDDFDQMEEEEGDEESLAEDEELEKKLGREKIGKEELDALSVTSSVAGDSDSDEDSDANSDEDGSSACNDKAATQPRRSKRRRFTLQSSDGDGSNSERSRSPVPPTSDIGTLDVKNIVRGKRNRSKVDYRKLADAMFGDESDDEAKGTKKEYTYRPKQNKARARRSHNSDDSDDEDGNESEGNHSEEEAPKKKKARKSSHGSKTASKKARKSRDDDDRKATKTNGTDKKGSAKSPRQRNRK